MGQAVQRPVAEELATSSFFTWPNAECQLTGCAGSNDGDYVFQPTYAEHMSYISTGMNGIFEDFEGSKSWQDLDPCKPLNDIVPCQCGPEDDENEFQDRPIYPELGSYIRKKPVLAQHTHPSDPCASPRPVDPQDFSAGRRSGKILDEIFNFTPLFLAVPGEGGGGGGKPACDYTPSTTDEMDMEVKRNLDNLDAIVSKELCLRRKRLGVYEIDGRQVNVYWRHANDGDPFQNHLRGGPSELYVNEDMFGTSDDHDVPLSLYLEQVSHVLLSTQKHGMAGPIFGNMTFVDIQGVDLSRLRDGNSAMSFSNDRNRAMHLACSQAALRKALA